MDPDPIVISSDSDETGLPAVDRKRREHDSGLRDSLSSSNSTESLPSLDTIFGNTKYNSQKDTPSVDEASEDQEKTAALKSNIKLKRFKDASSSSLSLNKGKETDGYNSKNANELKSPAKKTKVSDNNRDDSLCDFTLESSNDDNVPSSKIKLSNPTQPSAQGKTVQLSNKTRARAKRSRGIGTKKRSPTLKELCVKSTSSTSRCGEGTIKKHLIKFASRSKNSLGKLAENNCDKESDNGNHAVDKTSKTSNMQEDEIDSDDDDADSLATALQSGDSDLKTIVGGRSVSSNINGHSNSANISREKSLIEYRDTSNTVAEYSMDDTLFGNTTEMSIQEVVELESETVGTSKVEESNVLEVKTTQMAILTQTRRFVSSAVSRNNNNTKPATYQRQGYEEEALSPTSSSEHDSSNTKCNSQKEKTAALKCNIKLKRYRDIGDVKVPSSSSLSLNKQKETDGYNSKNANESKPRAKKTKLSDNNRDVSLYDFTLESSNDDNDDNVPSSKIKLSNPTQPSAHRANLSQGIRTKKRSPTLKKFDELPNEESENTGKNDQQPVTSHPTMRNEIRDIGDSSYSQEEVIEISDSESEDFGHLSKSVLDSDNESMKSSHSGSMFKVEPDSDNEGQNCGQLNMLPPSDYDIDSEFLQSSATVSRGLDPIHPVNTAVEVIQNLDIQTHSQESDVPNRTQQSNQKETEDSVVRFEKSDPEVRKVAHSQRLNSLEGQDSDVQMESQDLLVQSGTRTIGVLNGTQMVDVQEDLEDHLDVLEGTQRFDVQEDLKDNLEDFEGTQRFDVQEDEENDPEVFEGTQRFDVQEDEEDDCDVFEGTQRFDVQEDEEDDCDVFEGTQRFDVQEDKEDDRDVFEGTKGFDAQEDIHDPDFFEGTRRFNIQDDFEIPKDHKEKQSSHLEKQKRPDIRRETAISLASPSGDHLSNICEKTSSLQTNLTPLEAKPFPDTPITMSAQIQETEVSRTSKGKFLQKSPSNDFHGNVSPKRSKSSSDVINHSSKGAGRCLMGKSPCLDEVPSSSVVECPSSARRSISVDEAAQISKLNQIVEKARQKPGAKQARLIKPPTPRKIGAHKCRRNTSVSPKKNAPEPVARIPRREERTKPVRSNPCRPSDDDRFRGIEPAKHKMHERRAGTVSTSRAIKSVPKVSNRSAVSRNDKLFSDLNQPAGPSLVRKKSGDSAATSKPFTKKVTFEPCLSAAANTQEEYNSSQLRAIRNTVTAILEPWALPRICLLQGPPGSGKSRTIVGIIATLFKEFKRQPNTVDKTKLILLVCAPSNAGVDELFRRLIIYRRTQEKNAHLKILRIGSSKNIHPSVIQFSLEKITQKEFNLRMSKGCQVERIESEKISLVTEINTLKNTMEHHSNDPARITKLRDDIKKLESRKNWLGAQQKKVQENNFSKLEHQRIEDDIRRSLIVKADVICCTLNCSENDILFDTMKKNKLLFSAVIVDEAAQSTECLVPLQTNCSTLVLVGDPEQLQPTVLSKVAADMNFGQSLFERFYTHFKHRDDIPIMLLETQYRMHPEIAAFPSRHTYGGKLKTDPSVIKRKGSASYPLKPYLLFNLLHNREQSEGSGQIFNREEADCIRHICHGIEKQLKPNVCSIGIITPYQCQKTLIENQLKAWNLTNIEVNTVDGFQGREKDIIIISCVRACSEGGRIGMQKLESPEWTVLNTPVTATRSEVTGTKIPLTANGTSTCASVSKTPLTKEGMSSQKCAALTVSYKGIVPISSSSSEDGDMPTSTFKTPVKATGGKTPTNEGRMSPQKRTKVPKTCKEITPISTSSDDEEEETLPTTSNGTPGGGSRTKSAPVSTKKVTPNKTPANCRKREKRSDSEENEEYSESDASLSSCSKKKKKSRKLSRKAASRNLKTPSNKTPKSKTFHPPSMTPSVPPCPVPASKSLSVLEQASVGFLANPQRLNVALTRARFSLFVVGHFDSLKVNTDWKALIDDGRMRNLIVDIRDVTEKVVDHLVEKKDKKS